MAVRPLCFGLKFHDKGRSFRVQVTNREPQTYEVEVAGPGRGRPVVRREHPSLSWALRDFAQAWRSRLH